MSKGGAGKVYFILYLAVLLELLIIIVERDDAEEELKREKEALARKNKRIQLIAETIINALRGSQTSDSSTSDQSMTLGDPKEPEREFSVKVRVSDPRKDTVNDLSLTILRNDAKMDSIDMTRDTSLFPRVLQGQDYIFKYKFKPSYGEGTYRLRFNARTNQIVGVSQSHVPDDTVKIGAVHLTVGELEEVKNGITENVALKGFIDSLLTGNYSNFSTNLGANEFIVNVKRPEEKVTDQLAVFPTEADFSAFPGIELPNPIKIEGAESKGVTVTKIEGPGEFVRVDTNWVWKFTPTQGDVGQSYTVKFRGEAKRGGGPKDIANSQFSVVVKALTPVAGDTAVYFPLDDEGKPVAYTKVPFTINGKFKDLDGSYKIVLTLNGAEYKTVNEPTVEVTPKFLEDENKKLGVSIQFKSLFMKEYKELKKDEIPILAPPLNASGSKRLAAEDKVVKFQAGFGIEGHFSETSGDLDAQSEGGYFDNKATKGDAFNFTLRLIKKPTGTKDITVKVNLRDPATGQTAHMNVIIAMKGRR
jgi:hypothetical protein